MFCGNCKAFLKIRNSPGAWGLTSTPALSGRLPLLNSWACWYLPAGASPALCSAPLRKTAQGLCKRQTSLKEKFYIRDKKTRKTGLYMFKFIKILWLCHGQFLSAHIFRRLHPVAPGPLLSIFSFLFLSFLLFSPLFLIFAWLYFLT